MSTQPAAQMKARGEPFYLYNAGNSIRLIQSRVAGQRMPFCTVRCFKVSMSLLSLLYPARRARLVCTAASPSAYPSCSKLSAAPRALLAMLLSATVSTGLLLNPAAALATTTQKLPGQGRPSLHRQKHKPLAAVEVPPSVLPAPVALALARAHVPPSAISVLVVRAGSNKPVLEMNAQRAMSPASTMKLITTFSGLSILGPGYRWKTSAYAQGPVDNGILHGNLYIVGTGDPKLVPEELIDLVQKIHAAGITGVDGSLVLDKHNFDVSTRDAGPYDDEVLAPYNVGPDPLLYAFKSLSFTLSPEHGRAVAIDVIPPLDNLKIVNDLHLTNGRCVGEMVTPVVTQAADGSARAVFDGKYPLSCGEREANLAALDHSVFFADGFLALWKQTGGTFQGSISEGITPPDAREVAVHESPVLSDIVRDINKFSNNVMARNLFLTIGEVSGHKPSTLAGSAQQVEQFLHRSGLPMTDLVLENGSGLSHDERISAASMADLLQVANASPVAQAYVDSLPIVGVDGTMLNRLVNSGIEGNAHIKTGTLRDVRAIAGYVGTASGDGYIVVSFINDPHAEGARAAHDALLQWVYQDAPALDRGNTASDPALKAVPQAGPTRVGQTE